MNKYLTFVLTCLFSYSAFSQVPVTTAPGDVEDFPSSSFCTTTTLTNSGSPGFGPYLRIVVPEDLNLDSYSLFGIGGAIETVGVFPAPPGNELIDPVTGELVTGNEGDTFYIIQPPIGSVVDGGVPLAFEVCFTIDPNAPINVPINVGITPAYEFGDTATGANGPITGGSVNFNVTPVLVELNKTANVPEGERPTGPSWPVTYTLSALVAPNNTITDFVIADTLPPGFVLNVGSIVIVGGTGCVLDNSNPFSVSCTSVTGDAVPASADVVVTYSGYYDDVLDDSFCDATTATNTATLDGEFMSVAIPQNTDSVNVEVEHISLQKGADPAAVSPNDVVTFDIEIQVSDFVAANSLVVTDILPDGYTYDATSSVVSLNGTAIAVTPVVSLNTPATGQTRLVFNITAVTGDVAGGSALTISYMASVDQIYDSNSESLLANDALTNVASLAYGLTAGAAACSEGSLATTTVLPVETSKSVVNPQPFYMAGDVVTYRLTLQVPSGDTRDVVFTDFLPLPVFDATTVNTTFGVDVVLSPDDTLNLTPDSINFDGATNSVSINWPNITTTSAQTLSVDLSVTIVDTPFADNLNLSNLLQTTTDNTVLTATVGVAPVLILVRSPDLTLTKGVLSADQGIIFPLPAVLPVDGDVIDVDANDSITYQITVENTGGSSAFDVVINDPAVPGLTACGIDSVTDGNNSALAFTGDLVTGIVLTNPLAANDDLPVGGGSPFSTDTALVNVTCNVVANAVFNTTYENTATVTYAATNSGPTFPVESDTATFTTTSPDIDKTILQVLPNVDGVDNTVAIGETIQYQVVITVPEGQGNNSQLVDLLDTGLVFQSFDSVTGSSDVASSLGFPAVLAGASTLNSRNGLFNFGTVNNNNTANGTVDTITVVYTVLVTDITGNNAGGNRNNQADFITDTTSVRVNAPNRQIREPLLTVAKSASPTNADAGDTVTYTITVRNNGRDTNRLSPAFDVALVDLLADTDLTLVAGTVVASQGIITLGNSIGDTTIDVSVGNLAINGFMTVTFDAVISDTVESGDTVSNTATVTDYNSIPGGGRGYADVSGTANVSIISATAVKTVLGATSTEQTDGIATQGMPGLVDLTIGEEVTFEITTTLAEGVSPTVVITDNLPNSAAGQMAYVSASVVSVGANLSPNATLLLTPAVPSGTSSVSFDFGQVTNAPDGTVDAGDQIVIQVTGRVTDIPANAGIEELINNVIVQFNSGLNATTQATIEVVEPRMTIDKTSLTSVADAGDVVTFVLTIDNLLANGTSANAFDVMLTDMIPVGFTYVPLSLTQNSGPLATSLGDAGGVITATWNQFDIADIAVLSFDVTVDNTVSPNQTIQNTASIDWTSLPGTQVPVIERTSSDSDTHDITIGNTGLVKTVVSTSEPSSGTAVSGGEDDLTIGEEVTYQFIATFPEGTALNAVAADQLPTGTSILSVVSSEIVSVGGNLTISTGLGAGDPGVASNTDLDTYDDRVEWNLGIVANAPDGLNNADDEIVFEVVALVVNDPNDPPVNQGGANDVVNTASLTYDGGGTSGTALVDLVEPRLNIAKQTLPAVVLADAGDTINYQLTIDHIGTSSADAFNLVITDLLPDPGVSWIDDTATNFSSTCGAMVDSSGDPSIEFTISQLALAAGSCTISYNAVVDLAVKPGATYTNDVTMDYDSTPVFVAGATRRTTDASSAEFNIGVPSITKAVSMTSLADTGSNFGDVMTNDLAIGELVDYVITLTVPEGTSNNATLLDNLPVAASGGAMEVVSAAVVTIGNNITTTLPGTPVLTDTDADTLDDQVLFDFGNIINSPDMVVDVDDQISVIITARVIDIPANVAIDTLINDALFTYGLNGNTISDSVDVEVVEPNLGLAKSLGSPNNLVVPITLTLNNTGGSASAYDLTLVDVLDGAVWDLTTIAATNIPSGFDFVVTPGPGANESTVTISSSAGAPLADSSIAPNEVLVFEFTAAIRDDIAFPNSIVNTATLTEASSMPGTDGGERDYSDITAMDTLQLAALDSTKSDALLIDNGGVGVANPNDTLRYTIVIDNTGAGDATTVVFSDAPDVNTTLVVGSVTTTQGAVTTGNTAGDGTVVVNVGTLAGASDVTITFDVTVNNPFPQAVNEISNQGMIESNEFPPSITDDPDDVGGVVDDPTVTPIGAGHDLTVSKDDGVITAEAGDTVIYTISYANIGNQNSTGVVLTETVPNNSTFNAASSTSIPAWSCADGSPTGTVCTLAVGDLDGGDSGMALFAIDIFDPKPSGVIEILNTVTIGDDGNNGADDDTTNNSGDETTPIDAAPDLTLTKTSNGADVVPGEAIVYTLSYQNIGTQDATGVVITETVPANTTFNFGSSTPTWSCADGSPATTVCTYTIGNLAAGQAAQSIDFAVNVVNPLADGVIEINNAASIGDDGNNGDDTDLTNNGDDEDTTVVAVPDLIVSKDDGGITVGAGDTIPYVITYQNIGNQEATGVELTETVPVNTAFNAGASGAWVCTPNINAGSTCTLPIGSVLGGGGSGTAVFAVDVVAPKPSGVTVINNTVSIGDDGNNGAEDTSNNMGSDNTPVDAAPDLSLVKMSQSNIVSAGQTLIYDLTYQNTGTQDATGVFITETVPASSTFNQASSTPTWSCADGAVAGSPCVLNIGAVAAGAAAQTVQFAINIVDPLPAGTDEIFNSARIDDDGNNGDDLNPGDNNNDDTTSVGAAPDMLITKTDVVDPVEAGSVIVYNLSYQNIGNQDATGVVITETVPANTTYDAAGSSAGWSCTNGNPASTVCTLGIGAVAAGDPAAVVLFAVEIIDPVADGLETISNSASIADDGNNGDDPDLNNNGDDEDTTVVAVPDLIVSKDDGGITVGAGDTIPYVITYQNIGNQEATGVVLTETVPDNTAFNAGASDAWVCTPNINAGSSCTLSVGSLLGGGASGTVTFAVDVVAPKPSGVTVINNTVSIVDDGNNGDEDTTNNSGSDNTPVDAAPDLSLVKSSQVSIIDADEVLIYDLTYQNTGTQDATGVFITETVPTNSTFNQAGSTATWSCADGSAAGTSCILNVGAVAAGDAAQTVQFAIRIDNPLPAGLDEIFNSARIDDDGNNGDDLNPDNNDDDDSTTIGAAPDLLIMKSDVENLVAAGGVIVYQLSYQNIGNQDATGVVITETVPANTTFNAANSTATWSCTDGSVAGTLCTFLVGDVDAGDMLQMIEFAVNVPNPIPAGVDTVNNSVSIEDDSFNGGDADTSNNNDDEETIIGAFPDLSINKTDNGVTSAPGGVVIYVLDYANIGTQDATGVTITETVPDNTRFDVADSPAGWVCLPSNAAGSTCEFTVGDLNAGDSGSVNFAVQVDDPLAPGVNEIFNTARIDDDGTNGDDVDTTNNSDSDDTSVLLDPPVGIKYGSIDANNPALINWRFYWFNPNNNRDLPVFIFDPMPTSTAYIQGSASCVATGSSSCTVPTYNQSLNQIELTAVIAPDEGAPVDATEDQLNNEVVITFQTRIVASGPVAIFNQAQANWDENNDGDPNNDAENGQPPVLTDSPVTPQYGDPTGVRTALPVPALSLWSLLIMIVMLGAVSCHHRRRLASV